MEKKGQGAERTHTGRDMMWKSQQKPGKEQEGKRPRCLAQNRGLADINRVRVYHNDDGDGARKAPDQLIMDGNPAEVRVPIALRVQAD